MKKEVGKKLISLIFMSIFVSKMVISVAPLIISHFDPGAVNAVIMQLEIEHSKTCDSGKEAASTKEFITTISYGISIPDPIWIVKPLRGNVDQDKHHQPFYPSVPTPPPNA